jgi:hypothetical protein
MNLPIIFRCAAGIFRFCGHCNLHESSDNLPARRCNLPMNNRPIIVRQTKPMVSAPTNAHSV